MGEPEGLCRSEGERIHVGWLQGLIKMSLWMHSCLKHDFKAALFTANIVVFANVVEMFLDQGNKHLYNQ